MKKGSRSVNRFPWILLLLLLGTVYLFWILPHQIGPLPLRVEFDAPEKLTPERS